MGSSNFQTELQYVAEFAKHYVIGPNNVQIGIVTFASFVRNEFEMNTTKNINDLEKAILNVNYIPGSTHTGTALQYVRLNSFKPHTGERNNVPNFLVVITDGKSNGNIPVISEASILHKSTNIETFAIGVGQGVNKPELDAIASSPSHVLSVTDFLNLHIGLKEIRCGKFEVYYLP